MVGRRWIETTIGALVGCKQVSIQTGPFGTVLSASEYVDYGIPVISVREIRQGRIEIYDETPAVSDSTYRRLSQFALKPYDLVFARKGSVDRSALIAEDAQKMFLGSDGIRLRFNNPTLAQIVFHCVQSPQTRQFLTVSAYGTTMAGLNETIISSIPICIPEDAMEQQHIAKALSDMDDMITSLEKLIAKKKAIKQGAMQELLTGKRRLLGFCGEWDNASIDDIAEFQTSTIPIEMIDIKYYIGTDNMISNKGGVRENIIAIPYAVVREYRAGDILLSNIRPYLKKIWLADKNGGCSNDVLVIRTKDKESCIPAFLYYCLCQDRFFDKVMANAVGTWDKNAARRQSGDSELSHSSSQRSRRTGRDCRHFEGY